MIMLRICTTCNVEKEIEKFVKTDGYYRHKCKDCANAIRRTGKPHLGRFKKGQGYWLGKKLPESAKLKVSLANKGRICSKEEIEKRRLANLGRGKSRQSYRYQIWRNSILERDGNKCIKCSSIENLHCHHILPWKNDIEKRLDIENGQTLCASCHALEGMNTGEIKNEKTRFKKGMTPWNKRKTNGCNER